MTTYPAALWTPPTRADGVDQVTAADYNTPAGEIAAVMAELGTNPKGSAASVKARLDRTDTIGASIYRAATTSAAGDTATGARTLVGYDTTRRADTGFTVSLGAGTITVPSDGYYAVTAHTRFSAAYVGGFVLLSIADGSNELLRGQQDTSASGGYLDAHVSGTTDWTTAGTALHVVLFTATSTSLVGNAAGTQYTFRVVRL